MKTAQMIGLVFAVLVTAFNASAGLTFDLGYIYDGPGVPTNAGPWVSIEIVNDGDDTVRLTLTTPNLTESEKVKQVYLNLDPSLNPADLVFSSFSSYGVVEQPVAWHTPTQPADYKAGGDGVYDIRIDFETNTAGAFNGGEAVLCTITMPGLTENSFDFNSSSSGGSGKDVLKAAAHIISLGDEKDSAWATVPEPATMILLGLGSVLLRRL